MEEKVTVELTRDQFNDLRFYLILSTKYRIEEKEACEELSKKVDEDGNIKYPNMKSDAEFWASMNDQIETVITSLRECRSHMIEIFWALVESVIIGAVVFTLCFWVAFSQAKKKGISVWEELFREDE